MAIFHLTAKTGSRSKGQSAKAKSDYITRSGKYSNDRDEVLYSSSDHMPMWAADEYDYWKGADVYERSNGRLYKEIEFSLPVELGLDQQIELAESFAKHLTHDENLPFTLAIHSGKGHNPHCHLMISERVNDGLFRSPEKWFKRHDRKKPDNSGARKTDKLKPKKWLEQTRSDWASMANFALERAGFDDRIDHRTLEAQGIDRVPQIHIGQSAMAMERKGLITDRGKEFMEIMEVNAEYERLKNLEREQAERKANPRPEPEVIRSAEEPRPSGGPGSKVVGARKQSRPEDGVLAKSKSKPGVWGRLRGWFVDRLLSRADEPVHRDDKPVVTESDELKMLKKRIRMTPEERVIVDRDRLNERLEKLRERDKSQADDYARSIENRPISPTPNTGRSHEM